MLSSQEQRIWDDVLRFWAEEAEEPRRPVLSASTRAGAASSRDAADPPIAVAVGVRIVVLLLLFGAASAALAVSVATALGWALWRTWPRFTEWTASGRSAPRSWTD